MIYFLLIISGYLLGSIPFGYLVGRYLKGIDIREHGSGNIGVANAFRVLGSKCAVLVLFGDCLKGFISVYFARWLLSENIAFYLIVGLTAIIGHNWSVFLKFKGGKGIATTYGVVLAFYPNIAIISALVWGFIVVKTKFAALGSIVSVLFMVILALLLNTVNPFKIFTFIVLLFAIIRHWSNIIRLIHKKENKIINNKSNKNI